MEIILVVALLLIAIAGYKFWDARQKKNDKEPDETGSLTSRVNESDYETRVIEVASRAALADGVVEDKEVAMICGIAAGFVPGIVSPDQVRDMVEYIRQNPAKTDFLDIGTGLDDLQRQQLLRIAIQVIGKESIHEGAGKEFVDNLSMGLLILPEQRNAIASTIEDIPRAAP